VEIKNIIIKILYLIIKHLWHRDLVIEANLQFNLSNINFATSNFLGVGLSTKAVFSKSILHIPFRTCFRLYRSSVAENMFRLLRGLFGKNTDIFSILLLLEMTLVTPVK